MACSEIDPSPTKRGMASPRVVCCFLNFCSAFQQFLTSLHCINTAVRCPWRVCADIFLTIFLHVFKGGRTLLTILCRALTKMVAYLRGRFTEPVPDACVLAPGCEASRVGRAAAQLVGEVPGTGSGGVPLARGRGGRCLRVVVGRFQRYEDPHRENYLS